MRFHGPLGPNWRGREKRNYILFSGATNPKVRCQIRCVQQRSSVLCTYDRSKHEIPVYDSRAAKRPQTTHAVVRVLQGIRRTEKNTGMAHFEWWTDRIPYAGKFLQSETDTKESACCVPRGKQGRSSDFWNGANSYRPERSGAGLPKLLEGSPGKDGDGDRTSSLDRDAVEQARGSSCPAGRAESPSGAD